MIRVLERLEAPIGVGSHTLPTGSRDLSGCPRILEDAIRWLATIPRSLYVLPLSDRTALPLFQVDAFTREPLAGNPAAVCLLEAPRPEAWMQKVAAEMNLSETAFLVPRADGYDLRWFTPTHEVPLCGHATVASAHILRESGRAGGGPGAIRFHTLSGILVARRAGARIELDLPAYPPREAPLPARVPMEMLQSSEYLTAGQAFPPRNWRTSSARSTAWPMRATISRAAWDLGSLLPNVWRVSTAGAFTLQTEPAADSKSC